MHSVRAKPARTTAKAFRMDSLGFSVLEILGRLIVGEFTTEGADFREARGKAHIVRAEPARTIVKASRMDSRCFAVLGSLAGPSLGCSPPRASIPEGEPAARCTRQGFWLRSSSLRAPFLEERPSARCACQGQAGSHNCQCLDGIMGSPLVEELITEDFSSKDEIGSSSWVEEFISGGFDFEVATMGKPLDEERIKLALF